MLSGPSVAGHASRSLVRIVILIPWFTPCVGWSPSQEFSMHVSLLLLWVLLHLESHEKTYCTPVYSNWAFFLRLCERVWV